MQALDRGQCAKLNQRGRMTPAELKASASRDSAPAAGLSDEARALWLCEAGQWEDAHAVAQDIHTPLGSWIHALLHLIEGDEGNARYWFARAGRAPVGREAISEEWKRIAAAVLGSK
jgi:hypothetical protein